MHQKVLRPSDNKQVPEEVSRPVEEIKKPQANDISSIKPTAALLAGNELEQRIFQLHQALVQLKHKLMMLNDGLNTIAHKLSGQKNNATTEPDDISKRIQDLFLQAKDKPKIIVDSDAESIFSYFIVNINSHKDDSTLINAINASIIDLVKTSRTFLQQHDKPKKVAKVKNALMTIQSFLQTLKQNNLISKEVLDSLRKERPQGSLIQSSGKRHIHADIMEFIDAIIE